MLIHPEVFATPDCPTVKLREPRETVDLPKVLDNILKHNGWDVGTYFNVQFISHDRQALLAEARFVVTNISESLQTNDANPYQTVTKSVVNRNCVQRGDWWVAEKAQERSAKWNPGKQVYEIFQDGVVIDQTRDKEEAHALAAA